MPKLSYIYKGQICSEESLSLGLNRAFRYGDGLFETLRIIHGKPQNYSEHLRRLTQGLKQLKIDFTAQQQKEMLRLISELLITQSMQGGILRIFVFRRGGGRYTPEENNADYLVEVEPLRENEFQLNTRGLNLNIAQIRLHKFSSTNGLKSLSALPHVLASVEKQERRLDDLLFLNEEGFLVEATSSNIFLCFGNEIHTPPLSDGCLPGIMRQQVLKLANKEGIKTVERSMGLEDLIDAEECFLTNSIAGIKWVVAFRDKRYYNRQSKKLIALINAKVN